MSPGPIGRREGFDAVRCTQEGSEHSSAVGLVSGEGGSAILFFDDLFVSTVDKKRGEAMTEEQREALKSAGESVKPTLTAPSAGELGRDFLTGCVALIVIGVVVFLLIPLLVLVLKVSLLIAIPVGGLVLLLFFTTLFGRIINTLRKRW
jgi:hypothetical protein